MPYRSDPSLHAHPFAEFYCCVRDIGSQHTEAGAVPMRPNDLFYFPARQRHIGNGPPGRTGKGIVLYVPDEAFSPLNSGDDDARGILHLLDELVVRCGNRVPLTTDAAPAVRHAMEQTAEEIRLAKPGFRCAAKTQLQTMLLAIARSGSFPTDLLQRHLLPPRQSRLQNLCRYLETHYTQPLRVSELATMTNLGLSQFHALFKREMGCTCVEYLTRMRLQHAARLVRQTQYSMLRIAGDCGFPCLSHFYHVFRAHHGMTPRQMRMRMQKMATDSTD